MRSPPVAQLVGPGQAALADAVQHRGLHLFRIGLDERLVLDQQRAQPPPPPGQHAVVARVPLHDLLVDDPVLVKLLDLAHGDRRREEDARVLRCAVRLGHDQELLVRHRIALGQHGAAPAGQEVAVRCRRTPASDAVGIGERQQGTGHRRVGRLVARLARREPPRQLLDQPRRPAAQGDIDPVAQIDVALAQEVALAEDGRDQGGDPALLQLAALEHEMREPRMLAEPHHGAAMRRDRARQPRSRRDRAAARAPSPAPTRAAG